MPKAETIALTEGLATMFTGSGAGLRTEIDYDEDTGAWFSVDTPLGSFTINVSEVDK